MLGGFRAFKERLVIPAWVKFAEERTEHRFTLFGTDIDVNKTPKLTPKKKTKQMNERKYKLICVRKGKTN